MIIAPLVLTTLIVGIAKLGDIKEEDGKHIIMSSRFPHWAENGSDEDRIILYLEYYNSSNREC